jgi:catechol 2,3-dioxygenase-like lactoylglutathione lyase family enzyme
MSAPAADRPFKVRKIGHVVYTVSDVDRSVKFWTDVMGFKVSDTNEHGMVFLRCQTDHHTIGLQAGEPGAKLPNARAGDALGVTHFAMELASVDELLKARDFMRAHGVTIAAEGRRGPGSNLELHVLDPDGYNIELYAEMEQVGWNGQTRPASSWRRADSLDEALANPVPAE